MKEESFSFGCFNNELDLYKLNTQILKIKEKVS